MSVSLILWNSSYSLQASGFSELEMRRGVEIVHLSHFWEVGLSAEPPWTAAELSIAHKGVLSKEQTH